MRDNAKNQNSAAIAGLSHCYSRQKLATLLSGFLLPKFEDGVCQIRGHDVANDLGAIAAIAVYRHLSVYRYLSIVGGDAASLCSTD